MKNMRIFSTMSELESSAVYDVCVDYANDVDKILVRDLVGSTITFSWYFEYAGVDGIYENASTFEAVYGMTWSEWIDGKYYNKGSKFDVWPSIVDGCLVFEYDGHEFYVTDKSGARVNVGDVIVGGHEYGSEQISD